MHNDNNIFDNSRLSIAYLCEGVNNPYQAGLWRGLKDAAKTHGLNLICICGGYLEQSPYNPFERQRNELYELFDEHTFDGLIFAAGIGAFCSAQTFESFLKRWQAIPAITIGPAISSLPSVEVNSVSGMENLVDHLVDNHKYRRFAFIKGPEGNREGQQRYKAFLDRLQYHGIDVDSRLIIQGAFDRTSGRIAAEQLIGLKEAIDVIVAANDEMACAAIEVLQSNGINVPFDIAVTGFDNSEESMFVSPPLTTINQPLYHLGYTAVDNLVNLIYGKTIKRHTELSSQLIVRGSCGCQWGLIKQINENDNQTPWPLNAVSASDEEIAKYIHYKLEENGICSPFIKQKTIEECCACLRHSLYTKQEKYFLRKFQQSLGSELRTDRSIAHWINTLEIMKHIFAAHLDQKTQDFLQYLFDNAFSIITHTSSRMQGLYRLAIQRKSEMVRTVGTTLANSLDVNQVLEEIRTTFGGLGIKRSYVCISKGDENGQGASNLFFATTSQTQKTGFHSKILTSKLLAAGAISGPEPQIFIALPLYFAKEKFGHIVMEDGDCDLVTYEVLAEHVSTGLHSSFLFDRLHDQSSKLEQAHRDLKALREKEHQYLEALTHELELGRKIQMGFLPQALPKLLHWEIASEFLPASKVSGDFYDIFLLNESTLVAVIGDVSGKHISAALLMAIIVTLIRIFVEQLNESSQNPLLAVDIVNNYLLRRYRSCGTGQVYATMILALLDITTGNVTFVNAGHINPLLVHSNGAISRLPTSGPAIGLIKACKYNQHFFTIEKGSMLFAYTDGITESRNSKGEFFGKKRLIDLLLSSRCCAQQSVKQVRAALHSHSGNIAISDDVTMLAIARL